MLYPAIDSVQDFSHDSSSNISDPCDETFFQSLIPYEIVLVIDAVTMTWSKGQTALQRFIRYPSLSWVLLNRIDGLETDSREICKQRVISSIPAKRQVDDNGTTTQYYTRMNPDRVVLICARWAHECRSLLNLIESNSGQIPDLTVLEQHRWFNDFCADAFGIGFRWEEVSPSDLPKCMDKMRKMAQRLLKESGMENLGKRIL